MIVSNNISHKKKELRLKTSDYSFQQQSSITNKNFNNKYMDLLENNSSELAFRGSFNKSTVHMADELLQLVDKKFAEYVVKGIEDVTLKTKDKFFVFDKTTQKLIVQPRSAATFFKESALYPVTQMPLDMLNFGAKLLKKIGISGLYDSKFLSNHRANIATRQQVDSITGFFGTLSKMLPDGKKFEELSVEEKERISAFLNKSTQKIFDSGTGHYDVAKERSLNRIVSGMIPAFFLANDAYNLSRLIDDDPKEANKESKTRFRQELVRVFATAYFQLMMFGGFSKLVNNNKWASALLNVGIVLSTETGSRLLNGKPITFISKKQAEKLNEKESKKDNDKNVAAEAGNLFQTIKAASENGGAFVPQPLINKVKTTKEEDKNEFFSFRTLERWVLGSIGIGLVATYARKFPKVEGIYKKFTGVFKNTYEKLTTREATITRDDLMALLQRLKDEGLDAQAKFFEKQYSSQFDKPIINLGRENTRAQQAVNLVVGPFKFLWGTLALPFNLFKLGFSIITPETTKFFLKTTKPAKKFYPVSMLNKRMKSLSNEEFSKYLKNNLLESFNDISKSGVSNADLAKLVKVLSSTATSWFLIADNYNMVMMKSNGNDQKNAVQKGKERLVQRVSSIFYQTLLIDLFNNTFKTFYHSSLAGMSVITATCTLCQEIITRKAIGMPIIPHSKDEIENIEEKHNNQKGILGDYYRFMAKLIGKKQISQRNKPAEEK